MSQPWPCVEDSSYFHGLVLCRCLGPGWGLFFEYTGGFWALAVGAVVVGQTLLELLRPLYRRTRVATLMATL